MHQYKTRFSKADERAANIPELGRKSLIEDQAVAVRQLVGREATITLG
jgi:hypothetical protein